jgi:ferric-dicitrate binding protein FerR (iron transport regulator)
MTTEDQFKYLFQRFVENKCTKEELQEFYLLLQGKSDGEAFELLDEYYNGVQSNSNSERIDWNYMFQQITKKKKVPLRRISWKKMIAAASIILVLCVGAYLAIVGLPANNHKPSQETVATKDVAPPKGTRAVITLADGSKVYLDSANNGTIAQQSSVNVIKTADGKIQYNANGQALTANSPVYNTLTNPRGSKVIDMQLSDGSHVWLNAGSSVKYPVAFIGNERKVEITGEAYFEVAHDASKPFIVSKGETSVTVLGTHFNVNAYDDEVALRVTLLEGSVKVSAASKVVTIKPGEQAQVNGGNTIGLVVNRGVDVDQVMAWKNGYFSFNHSDLETVMRQIARWYDVDVSYEGKMPMMRFGGEVSRDNNLSQVLKILEESKVHFKIEGKRIIVLP